MRDFPDFSGATSHAMAEPGHLATYHAANSKRHIDSHPDGVVIQARCALRPWLPACAGDGVQIVDR